MFTVKITMNVQNQDDIFITVESFATKLAVMVLSCEGKLSFCFQGQGHRAHIINEEAGMAQ